MAAPLALEACSTSAPPGPTSCTSALQVRRCAVVLEGRSLALMTLTSSRCKESTASLAGVLKLCVDAVGRKVAGQASGVLAKGVTVGPMNVVTRTLTVFVDLGLAGDKSALHKLVFDEDGLIVTSDIFSGGE